MLNKVLLLITISLIIFNLNNKVFSQGVAINNSGSPADGSAMLDISSTNSGLLIPRMTSGERTGISSPANGLLVFQTDGDAGFYYYIGSTWLRITNADDASDFVSGTGTLNYVPKWTPDGVTIGNSLIFDNGSKVGIGTTSPDGRLHIEHSGTIGTTAYNMSNAWLRVGALGFDPNEITTDADLYITGQNFVRIGSGSANSIISVMPSENVGISNNSPSYKLDVSGTGRFTGQVIIPVTPTADAHAASKKYVDDEVGALLPTDNVTGTGTATRVAFWDGANTLSSNANLYWDNSNNRIGVGTSSPQTQLHITEDMQIGTDGVNRDNMLTFWAENNYEANLIMRETPTHGMGIRYNATDNNLYFDSYPNITTPSPVLTINRDSEFVGIGTTSPTAKFHTTGTVRFANYTNGFLQVDASGNLSVGTGSALFTAGTGLTWSGTTLNSVWTASGNDIYNNNTANIGIGTSSPDAKLHVIGDTYFGTNSGANEFRIGRQTARDVLQEEEVRFTVDDTFYTQHYIQDESSANFLFKLEATASESGTPSYAEFALRSTGLFNWNDKLYVSTAGNIGINTTSPSSQLHVLGTSGGDGTWNQGILIENNNATAGEPTVAFKNSSTGSNYWFTGLNQSAHYDIAYGTTFTNGNTFLRVETGGNIGIGTVSPSTQLHTTGGVRFQNLSGTGSRFVMADANGNLSTNTAVGSGIVSGSGTTNYISKWTPDGNTQGNSQIFDNGTNLGIGTSSPLVKFDVRGSSLFGTGFGPTVSTSNNIINLIVGINTSGASNGIAFYENTGGFGMKLGYDGSGSGTANKMAIYSDSDSELFTFQNGGNLGLGVAAPTQKLDIDGQVRIRGGNPGEGKVLTSDANGIATWEVTPSNVFGEASASTTTTIYSDSDITIQWNGSNYQPQFQQNTGSTQWWDVSYNVQNGAGTVYRDGDDIYATSGSFYYFSISGTLNTSLNIGSGSSYGSDGTYWLGRESTSGFKSYKLEIFRRGGYITYVVTVYN